MSYYKQLDRQKSQKILGHLPGNRIELVGKTNYYIGGSQTQGINDSRRVKQQMQHNFIGTIHSLSVTKNE